MPDPSHGTMRGPEGYTVACSREDVTPSAVKLRSSWRWARTGSPAMCRGGARCGSARGAMDCWPSFDHDRGPFIGWGWSFRLGDSPWDRYC